MPVFRQSILLFALNFFDAVLTIFWVRNGFASEGNGLMAMLLDIGDFPFLLVKLVVGGAAAAVLWYWGTLRIARYGLSVALTVYMGLMGIHFFTGLSAAGLISDAALLKFSLWSEAVLAFFI